MPTGSVEVLKWRRAGGEKRVTEASSARFRCEQRGTVPMDVAEVGWEEKKVERKELEGGGGEVGRRLRGEKRKSIER